MESQSKEPTSYEMLIIIATKMYKAGTNKKDVLKRIKELSRLRKEELELEFKRWF